VSGAGKPERLTESRAFHLPWDWSRDGRFLLYSETLARGADLWVLPLEHEGTPFPFLATEFDETSASFSPDGRWVAYMSNESGRFEIYVRDFAPGRSSSRMKYQISSGGGFSPRWRRDGREIYYRRGTKLYAASVTVSGTELQVSAGRVLFEVHSRAEFCGVSRDGRFLLLNPVGDPPTAAIHVLSNWHPRKSK
jgi:Tol biopolymer transport system component